MGLVDWAGSYYNWKMKNYIAHVFMNKQFINNLYRHPQDAYSLPIKENGDCYGLVDSRCNHYGLYTSISG